MVDGRRYGRHPSTCAVILLFLLTNNCAATRTVRASIRELRRGRRRVIPLPVLGRVPSMVRVLPKQQAFAFIPAHRALIPPGFHKDWHVAVRVASSKKLVGFVAAVPIHVRVRDKYASFHV